MSIETNDKEINEVIKKHLSPYFAEQNIPSYLYPVIREIVKERTSNIQKELDLWDSHNCQQNNL